MALTAAAGFAAALLLVLLLFLGLTTYNQVVAMGQRIGKAWANIEVALQQRHDELPNLVNAVRDVMGFEQGVLDDVTRLRAAWSREAPIPEQAAASEATSSAVRSLFAVVERYPDLRSHRNVGELQGEIERLEDLIAARRELYNDAVYRYNATIGQVPAALVADLFGWRPKEFFEAGSGTAAPARVALGR